MNMLKSLLTNKVMYIGLAVGIVAAIAFRRFIPTAVIRAANSLPASDAKQA